MKIRIAYKSPKSAFAQNLAIIADVAQQSSDSTHTPAPTGTKQKQRFVFVPYHRLVSLASLGRLSALMGLSFLLFRPVGYYSAFALHTGGL